MFEDLYNAFKKMSPLEKGAVLVITLGVVVFALYMRAKANANSQQQVSTTPNPASVIPGNPGDFFGGTPVTGLPTYNPPPASGLSGTPPTQGPITTQVLNTGTSPTGLLGPLAAIFNQGGTLYAEEPGATPVALNTLIPAGSTVFSGNQGRWWYETPGSQVQNLLTSGAGAPVSSGIGQVVKPPKTASTI